MNAFSLTPEDLRLLGRAVADAIERVHSSDRPFPDEEDSDPLALPEDGAAPEEIAALWRRVVDHSAHLSPAGLFGHMDSLSHPVAALTDAVVSALNNNPLWHEISPFASRVEGYLLDDLGRRMGLDPHARGVFTSGGSLANLTGLFAACGGFGDVADRSEVVLFCSEGAHASIRKSAAVLGIPGRNVIVVPCEPNGRMDAGVLAEVLRARPAKRPVIVAILGSTFHGAVDPLEDIARLAREHGAWLHVDAVYGGGLCFSARHRHWLAGLGQADSVSMAPQKWMYVPRLCAAVWIRDPARFEDALSWPLTYSVSERTHRGTFGLQGSRRADALTLWVTLNAIGTRRMGELVDEAIEKAPILHRVLENSGHLEPLHAPDLNLQLFRPRPALPREEMRRLHRTLTKDARVWVSLATWRGEDVFRAVILNPKTSESEFRTLEASLRPAAAG